MAASKNHRGIKIKNQFQSTVPSARNTSIIKNIKVRNQVTKALATAAILKQYEWTLVDTI